MFSWQGYNNVRGYNLFNVRGCLAGRDTIPEDAFTRKTVIMHLRHVPRQAKLDNVFLLLFFFFKIAIVFFFFFLVRKTILTPFCAKKQGQSKTSSSYFNPLNLKAQNKDNLKLISTLFTFSTLLPIQLLQATQ